MKLEVVCQRFGQPGVTRSGQPQSGFQGLAAAEDGSKLPDLWPAVDALECPTLFIRGENSDFLSRETLAALQRHNPLVEVVEVTGATHYVHDDNFDEFYRHLHGFLDRVLLSERKSLC